MAAPLLLDVRDRVATLRLNRPEAKNAVDEAMLGALASSVATIKDDPEVKAVVITGDADCFCVGLDIGLLARAFGDPDYFMDVLRRFKDALVSLESLGVPTIASVNGLARAGGFELLLACDFVIAADEARIGDTHLSSGIVPGGGASQRAVRKLGWQRAAELIFTGKFIDGKTAEYIGLALKSVPRSELDKTVDDLTDSFTTKSRSCLIATKSAMREGLTGSLEAGLEVELRYFENHLRTDPQSREGFQAFVEKREPAWP